ncbi:MAG: hypothetical protein FWD71_16300, partial [Oscillospiraceae bacterium]|nr:hypothetical protein [Oscillospiraceae bacterium]
MRDERFTDNISDETLVDITDKILNFEKNKKTRSIRINLLKIIPAVAAVVLVIGAINILPGMLKHTIGTSDNGNGSNVNAAVVNTTSDTSNNFNISSYTSETSTDNTVSTDTISQVNVDRSTVNINPKNLNKWLSSADAANTYVQDIDTVVRNGITVNTQVPTADGIEIYLPNGTVIKTHDTVKIANGRIIIAGNTAIDGNGTVTDEGSGKATIIDKDGGKVDINGGNQSTYTGTDPDG